MLPARFVSPAFSRPAPSGCMYIAQVYFYTRACDAYKNRQDVKGHSCTGLHRYKLPAPPYLEEEEEDIPDDVFPITALSIIYTCIYALYSQTLFFLKEPYTRSLSSIG